MFQKISEPVARRTNGRAVLSSDEPIRWLSRPDPPRPAANVRRARRRLPRRLVYGARAVAANALVYTLVYVFLTLGGGAPSTSDPFLAIPKPVYYAYDRFILAAGVAQPLARPPGGLIAFATYQGTFLIFNR